MKYISICCLLLTIACTPDQESAADFTEENSTETFLALSQRLLVTWSDAMVDLQFSDPADPTRYGALDCPACNKIHGRCMDAVYPFLYLADATGEQKYLDAAIAVMDWSENVSRPDGSWTVIPDPNSWRGITVFGAIALAEALKYHGRVLPEEVREKWTERLSAAAAFIYENFTMTYSHVNYGFTAVYALHLLGEVLGEPRYGERAAELAREIPDWLTPENGLLYGEDKPADKRSAKGLLPVDLGYNVEESLNGVVLYALATHNDTLLEVLEKSMAAHLEFMLPDGGWDNSWGTRQNKWSYWGSRTTDGCQPAFGLMAPRNPAFGTAALRNLQLLERTTVDGLLSGGLHYAEHGVKPCVHHAFAHAKSLAFVLDHRERMAAVNDKAPLPRAVADGVRHFPEVDVWLLARGPWRATVSSYDNVFKTPGSNQATGGALSMLWHEDIGPVFTASMAKYKLAEKNNQQPQPGPEFALTPRLEYFENGNWYTNLYDLGAEVATTDENGRITVEVTTRLLDADRQSPAKGVTGRLRYELNQNSCTISASCSGLPPSGEVRLVVPLISPSGEKMKMIGGEGIEIRKSDGTLRLTGDQPLRFISAPRERIFNMVPGVEVIPGYFRLGDKEVSCRIQWEAD